MRVGSLFSGIGGIELGFEREGFTTQWFVEHEPYAQAVLRKHFPNTKIYDDVRTALWCQLMPFDIWELAPHLKAQAILFGCACIRSSEDWRINLVPPGQPIIAKDERIKILFDEIVIRVGRRLRSEAVEYKDCGNYGKVALWYPGDVMDLLWQEFRKQK